MVEYTPIKCPRLNARHNPPTRKNPVVVEALLEFYANGGKRIHCTEYLGDNARCKSSEEHPNDILKCLYSEEGSPL